MCKLMLHILDRHLVDCTMPASALVPYLSHLPLPMAAVKLLYRRYIDACPCTLDWAYLCITGSTHSLVSINMTYYPSYGNFTLVAIHACTGHRCLLLHLFAAASFHDSLTIGRPTYHHPFDSRVPLMLIHHLICCHSTGRL
jgi:hypothetical protein